MDIKNKVVALTTQMSEINYDSEEDNIIKDSVLEIANNRITEEDDFEVLNKSSLRNINATIPISDDTYKGKSVSRKVDDNFYEDDINTDDSEDDNSHSERSDVEYDSQIESEEMEEEVEEDEQSGSETADKAASTLNKRNLLKPENYNIYSSGTRNVNEDMKKGIAIKNQLGLWETLLEFRIKLQKSLAASNKLPQKINFVQFKSLCTQEHTQIIEKTNRSILNVLNKLVTLQKKMLDQCPEFKSKLNEHAADEENTSDEEIPSSSDSEIDARDEDEEPPRKKIKLQQYPEILKKKFEEYTPYRNTSIQKWNDKTKIASGKLSNSNFSAFDQSTLKQIEQIMSDKERLVNRTRIKRSQYRILGTMPTEESTIKDTPEINEEIFDDDDFYHKLLRDFIERRTVDGSNSNQTERQWIELQKLRSKMKKKIDTKSTKGRRLRFVVLPKLVNFMAPVRYNTWNETAENELCNSLFGKITSR